MTGGSSHEDPNGDHPGDALPASPHLRWRRDALQPPHVQQDEFLQGHSGVDHPRFVLFGTFIPGNENAGGSSICIHKDLLPEDAIVVTHVVTCQGRDHICERTVRAPKFSGR